MRVRSVHLAIGLGMAVLAGCGNSQSDVHQTRVGVGLLRMALLAYDRRNPRDVEEAAAACRRAHQQISDDGALANLSVAGSQAAVGDALRRAFRLVLSGFDDCASSAPYGYVLMARAQTEIDQANVWLGRARSLDH